MDLTTGDRRTMSEEVKAQHWYDNERGFVGMGWLKQVS
jgi:hypothetical protein